MLPDSQAEKIRLCPPASQLQAIARTSLSPSRRSEMHGQLDHLISFALNKFSYVTTASLNGKFQWSHLSQPGIVASFEDAPSYLGGGQNERTLRVYNGSQLLDSIILRTLLDQIANEDATYGPQLVPDAARKVLILERKPFIAIRYPIYGQTRRIQMNFVTDSDFDQALVLLRAVGLPVRHKDIEARPNAQDAVLSTVQQQHVPYPISQGSSRPSLHQPAFPPYPASQSDYGPGPSSQPSQWMHQRPLGPAIGPSLVESFGAQSFQYHTDSQQTANPTHFHHALQFHPYTGYVPAEYRYHIPEQRNPHTAGNAATDPIRRSLFSNSCGSDEVGTTRVPTIADVLGTVVPPKRDLPFAKPPPRPATSRSNASKKNIEEPEKDEQPITPKPSSVANGSTVDSHLAAEELKIPAAPKRKRPASKAAAPPPRESPAATGTLSSPIMIASSPEIRPKTASAALKLPGVGEPLAKKQKVAASRPRTSRSQAKAKKGPSEQAKPEMKKAPAKQTQPTIDQTSHVALSAAPALPETQPAQNEADVSTDSGQSTIEPKETDPASKPARSSQSQPRARDGKFKSTKTAEPAPPPVSTPAENVPAAEPRTTTAIRSSQPVADPPATPSKQPAPERKGAPAPKKHEPSYASTGMQTSPPCPFPSGVTAFETPAEPAIASRPAAFCPTPEHLDVSLDWAATVEAFVLRHRARILPGVSVPLPSAGGDAGPATPTRSGTDVNGAAAHVAEETRASGELERLIRACMQAPEFERLCREVESVWARVGPAPSAGGEVGVGG